MKELFTIAHITDFHVGREINFPSGKIDLYDELLQTARKLVSMDPLPDLVMVGGDLANHGVDSDYMRVKKVLDEMNLPYCLVVGNHDSRSKMRAIFSEHSRLHTQSEYIQYVIENTPLRIIVLDTLAVGLYGIEHRLECQQPYHGNAYAQAESSKLPTSLASAAECLDKSEIARALFDDDVVEHYVHQAQLEARKYAAVVSEWELKRYFERI